MEKYLRDVMSDNKNGLYLCELPTGFGKTFTSVKLISEWIKENHSGRKIIFLTTLNKNLPEDELRDALGDAVYRQTVLRIRSNFDEVVEKLPELEISEQFQTESYQRLLQSIKQYIRAIRYEAGDRKYIIELENRVREAETGFRSMLTDHLRKVFPSKNARMEAIRHHADYRWMGKLYPAVFTDDYRVLMMSVNKFLTKNSVLTEPSYDFLKAPFIQNAIIFIDEFDATKATVKLEIIERSLGMKNDFLVLFRQLNRMLNTQHLSRKMRDSYAKIEEDKKARYTFSNLIKEADEIDEKYHTRLSYKTVESAIDRRQNFLLKDTSFHTVLQGGAKYIRAQVNRQQNVVDICFEDRKQHLANKQPDDIVIYSLIRDINRFLRHFKVFLFEWARHYCGLENNRRDSGRDRMTFENAVASIMDKLELSVPQRKLLMGELCEPLIWLKDEDIIPHVSFYQDGMEIFEFEDNDAHNDSTAINFVKVYDTPEKLLIYLARQSKVIGISATAEIPTVVGNYHLHYVEEVLGNRFHATPPEVKERIRRELEENNRAYQDGRISIYSKIVSTDYDGKEIDEICREITGETSGGGSQGGDTGSYGASIIDGLYFKEHYFTAPGWAGGLDPHLTFAGGKLTLTVPDGIGGEEWMGQVKLVADVPASPSTEYRFSCKIESSSDGSATVKVADANADAAHAFFHDNNVHLEAYDELSYVKAPVSPDQDYSAIMVIFDLGRMPAGAEITVTDIALCPKY